MARRSSSRVRQVQASGRPLRDANFLPKRERKAIRKGLVRGYVANKVADARLGAAQRAEFYRNLRQIKLRRIEIAKNFQHLADRLISLYEREQRLEDQVGGIDIKLLDEAIDAVAAAWKAVNEAASEFASFARQRVYYTEVL